MIGQTISHYKILEKLGEGGMGEVYLAEDTRLHRKVALKLRPLYLVGDEETRARFEREAQSAAALNHPNIVTIHEIGESEGQIYIAMEYVEGESLQKLIDRQTKVGQTLPLSQILDIAIQICEGLSKAHRVGVVHRDIKPDNLAFDREGRVKILDFGLAKLKGSRRLTEEAVTLGTVDYMSPEQAQGQPLDHRTDIWSLGVVIYEMATGKLPFSGESSIAVVHQILNQEPKSVPRLRSDIPKELDWILKKAMRKDPNERYQSVDEMLRDLKLLRKGSKSGVSLDLLAKRIVHRRRLFYLSGALAGFFIFLLAVGIYLFRDFGLQNKELEFPIPQSGIRTSQSLDRYRIAVLPFINISDDPENDYFADGVTEEMISTLSKITGLRVIARTSIMKYKGAPKSITEIGRELKVHVILEGSVRKVGNKVRVTAQLVDVQSQVHLWSQDYNRELKDVFAIQSDIAQKVAEELQMQLVTEEKLDIERKATENVEAYSLYLKGRYYLNKRTVEGLKKGIEHFKQAIERDPGYALAYAGLADAYNLLESYGALPPKEAYPKAKAAAEKALDLDDALAEPYTSLAFVKQRFDWDWSGAEDAFKYALALNTNYATAHHWYALYLIQRGRTEESLTEIKRAQELDPLSLIINTDVGRVFYYARWYDQAIEQHQKTLEIDSNFVRAYLDLGQVYRQKALYEEAIAAFQKALKPAGNSTVLLALLGHAYGVSGRNDKAQKVLDELKQRSDQGYIPPGYFAWVYLGLGEKDQALDWLEKAYEERASWLVFLKVDPLFDSLREDPRFITLLKKVGL